MNCSAFKRESPAEEYLLGKMTAKEAEQFEDHFFRCEHCFEEVKTMQAVRLELVETGPAWARLSSTPPNTASLWRWAWVAATLAVAVAGIGAMWIGRHPASPTQVTALRPQPMTALPVPIENKLAELARFDPPSYIRPRLRGLQTAAAEQFSEAMELYTKADYAAAITGLSAACVADESNPGSRFFLGVSYIMAGQMERGADALRQTISLGDSAYLEEARFYLAKALLRQGDTAGAQRELEAVAQLRGDMQTPARTLLRKLLLLQKGERK